MQSVPASGADHPIRQDSTDGLTIRPTDSRPAYFWDDCRRRAGLVFIFQKLSERGALDFQDTQKQEITARLRMPQFPLSPAQREAVMTFVLGLVRIRPRTVCVSARRTHAALTNGRSVTHFNAAVSCVRAGNLALAFPAGSIGEQLRQTTYPFWAA